MKTLNVKSTADDLNAETILDTRTLALPDGVSVSRTALVCSQQLSLDEWQSLGRALTQMESSIQWWIGDWWHYGRHRYGERKAKITAENAFERSYAFSTLMNYGWIAGRFKTSRRREVLSWSHHCEVAKLEPKQQDYWLDIAVKNNLSVAQLRIKLKEDEFLNDKMARAFDNGFSDLLHGLTKATEIDGRLIFTLPWMIPEFERFLANNLFGRRALLREAEKAVSFWTKIVEFVGGIESNHQARIEREKRYAEEKNGLLNGIVNEPVGRPPTK